MATDKRLDQVSTLTDFDYALIVKGDQVAKASKQQLAELVGNLLYGATNASSLATVVAEQMGFLRIANDTLTLKTVTYSFSFNTDDIFIGDLVVTSDKRDVAPYRASVYIYRQSVTVIPIGESDINAIATMTVNQKSITIVPKDYASVCLYNTAPKIVQVTMSIA